MRAWMLAFTLGTCLALYIPELPPFSMWWPVLGSLLVIIICRGFPLLGAYLLGLGLCLLHLQNLERKLLPKALEQQDIWVQGRVVGLPQKGQRSTRFRFKAERLCTAAAVSDCGQWQDWRRLLRLNDYEGSGLRPGQRWQLQVRLKLPHGFANPGTYDYEAWLWEQGFSATGYIRRHADNRQLGRGSRISFDTVRWRLRNELRQLSDASTVPMQQLPLILALSIGDRYQIMPEDWQVFSLAGVNHLMVISGLHIGLVALLAYHVSCWLWCRSSRLLLLLPAPRVAAVMSIVAAGVYSGLAGFSLPTRRAWIMVACLMWGRLVLRETHPLNGLCLALGLILLVNPLAPLSSGFWLSFAAVGLLLGFAIPSSGKEDETQHRSRLLAYVGGSVRAQYVLLLGLSPILLLHFQQLSLAAPLINLAAIPLVGLLVVPLCLLGMGLLPLNAVIAVIPLRLADLLLDGLMQWLNLLADRQPWLLLQVPALSLWGLLVLGMTVVLSLWRAAGHWRWLALSGLLVFLVPLRQRPSSGELDIHMLDVGQGLALVLVTHQQTWLYDTGPAYSERFNAGSIILEFLRSHNLGPVDGIIVSHGDNDHAGGLPAVLQAFPDAELISGEPERIRGKARACNGGESWQVDDVEFQVLYPEGPTETGNNASCIVLVRAGDRRVLLPGDIEARVERQVLRHRAEQLAADILIAPHHGSKSSSTPAFLQAVKPGLVLNSAGYLNRFGHPHPEVIERYQALGADVLNTAESGAVLLKLDRKGEVTVLEYRKEAQRVWR